MLKQALAIVLISSGAVCLLVAFVVSGKNLSDVIYLRQTKAKRVLARGASGVHPQLNPLHKRNSRIKVLFFIAVACFMIALGLMTHP